MSIMKNHIYRNKKILSIQDYNWEYSSTLTNAEWHKFMKHYSAKMGKT